MTKQVRIYLFLFLATLLAGLPAYGQVGGGIITLTTAKNIGEQIRLYIIADGDFTIGGVEGQPAQGYNDYTITNQQIVIRGNVTVLGCRENQLTALDVSQNTALTELLCYSNQLTALDVSQNTALTELLCYSNQLTALDVSQNTALTELLCYSNQLTALDVSMNTALEMLYCSSNQLTALNVSKNTALTKLACNHNQLTALDVSPNTALTSLFCDYNQLTALDVSKNTALTRLDCYNNQLTALDVSKIALTKLACNNNQLTVLDVSGCTALTTLDCSSNQLTALDVSQNTALTELDCYGNQIKGEEMARLVNSLPDRTDQYFGDFTVSQEPAPEGNICLKSDVAIAKGKNWNTQKYKSDTHEFVAYEEAEPSSYVISFTTTKAVGETVKLRLDYMGAAPTLSGLTGTPERREVVTYTLTSQTVTIQGDVTYLDCSANQITALDLSHNTALIELWCEYNQLTTLDVSKNTALTKLYCWGNQLTVLDLSKNTALTTLMCDNNRLTALDLSGCTALTTLECDNNQLTALDLSHNTVLTELDCSQNQLTALDISHNTALTKLWCQENQLTALDLSQNPELTKLDCSSNQLTALDVSGCTALTELNCDNNQLTALDVSPNTALTTLKCYKNQLTALDVSQNSALTELSCSINQLTTLEVSKNTALTVLGCNGNQLAALDVSNNTALTKFYCSSNQLTALDVSKNTALTVLACYQNQLSALDVSKNTALTVLACYQNQLSALDVSKNAALTKLYCFGNQINGREMARLVNSLPDLTGKESGTFFVVQEPAPEGNICLKSDVAIAKGKNWNTRKLDPATGMGDAYEGSEPSSYVISFTTTKAVGETVKLRLDYTGAAPMLTGATGMPESNKEVTYTLTSQTVTIRGDVTYLDCSANQITALDVSQNTSLTGLSCYENQLTALDVSQNTALTKFYCSSNQLTALDVSQNTSLTTLKCYNNQLTALNVSQNTSLTMLYCSSNQLTALDVSKNTALTWLLCYENQLTALNVSPNTALTWLVCDQNQLSALDVSKNTDLTTLGCSQNQLSALDVSKNTALTTLGCSQNQLSALDVSKNTALTALYCSQNQLSALDVSKNTALTALYCSSNQLTALDVSQNTALTGLACYQNQLSALDVSKNAALTKLYCFGNQINGREMARLVNSLPDLTGKDTGEFVVMQEPLPEGNRCFKSDVTIAKGKNWKALKMNLATDPWEKSNYDGLDAHPYEVTLTKEGEGTLNASGADNLNAVEYGTELSIEDTPAEGYELTALTANGTDILATKKLVVTGATEVKAVFAKKTFAVKLTKEGEGTLNATGAGNLNAVEYGTELTIDATPAEGYTLVALTANNTDILATRKVVVKEATEVKAIFAKKTFTVTLTKEGEGILRSTGAGNLKSVMYATELTIIATPADGYELKALTANGADILASKKAVVKEDTEVKAIFTKKTFAVELTQEGEGLLNATGADDLNAVPFDTELTIEATPAEGYELKALTANGTDILATNKFVVKGATEIKATFVRKPFTVTLTHEGEGTLNATGADNLNAVEYGSELTIVVTPAEGYYLMALTANGTDILATKKVVVKEATEVKATFVKKAFAVKLAHEGAGTLNATGADNLNAVEYDSELTIVATPAEGYYLMALTANGTDILATKKVVVKEVTEIKATFAKKTFGVMLTKEGEGSLNATGADNLNAVAYGTELTIEPVPAEGYSLVALTANGTDILATKKIVVKEATEVKVTFAKKTFAVTLTKEGEGILRSTGAGDLKSVMYATELTIIATPAQGYELKALTANGADILASKKVVVNEDTEVKAIFTKKTFAVELTQEGEGLLNATGSDDLTAVPFGTELTIEASPAEDYTLVALTANGADILATRKVVVKEATEVKATFAKKTFGVTLTKEGEGTLNATGADNLNAVEIDTELTIDTTPAEGYELKALTANGTDILATKKFVVKGATEIKATFTKKTAMDRVEAGSVRLYPNPASTYVNVKAAKADALVRLYDANGTLLYEARTDDHGLLQIELSAYAEGTYLLLVDGNAQRLLIQR